MKAGATRRLLCVVMAIGVGAFAPKSRGQGISPAGASGPLGYAMDDGWGASQSARGPVLLAVGPEVQRLPIPAAYSPDDDGGLAAQVAELAAEVEKLKASEASAAAAAAGRPSVVAGGRIMIDGATFSQNDASKAQAGNFLNGLEVRRARVYLKGDAYQVIDYKLQFELASSAKVPDFPGPGEIGIGQVSFKDVYITIKELPVLGNLRIGHFKTAFGLENLTSHRFATFMERAMVSEGEIEGRRMGIMAFDHNESERATWSMGVFTSQIPENPPRFQDDSGGYAAIARYSCLPWWDETAEGRGFLHTAVSYSYANIGGLAVVRFAERPESHLANTIIDTGRMMDVADINAIGLEAALVYGPLSLQSEFVSFWVDRTANPDPTFHGGYAYVSYFLTGESRGYNRQHAIFDRVKPFENFFRVRDERGCVRTGWGAWEVGYRYSYLDLNSSGANGGVAFIHTAGLNWYLNPNTRMMWNYVHPTVRDHPDAGGVGRSDIFQMRCQIDF